MTTKKKVGLAGIMNMQSRPVEVTTPTSQVPKEKVTKAKTTKAKSAISANKSQPKTLPKSKDKDFKLAGVYLRRTTVGQVKARLELSDQDMSELVEELLLNWLKKN